MFYSNIVYNPGFEITLVRSSETSKNDSWTSGIPAGLVRQTTGHFRFSHFGFWYIRTSDFHNPLARRTSAFNLKFRSLQSLCQQADWSTHWGQNSRFHIFKTFPSALLQRSVCVVIRISRKFVPGGSINDTSALVQVVWLRTCRYENQWWPSTMTRPLWAARS